MGRVSPDRQQALRTALYPADEEVLTDNISTYQSVLRRAFLGGLPKEPVASSPEALAWLFAYIDAMEARGIRPLRITQALRTLLVPMFPPLVEAR